MSHPKSYKKPLRTLTLPLPAFANERFAFPSDPLTPAAGAASATFSDVVRRIVDESLDLQSRCALLLMVLFQQRATEIVHLRRDQVTAQPTGALVAFARGPALFVIEPFARVVLAAANARGRWLFPSPREPTRHLSHRTLRKKLHALQLGAGLQTLRNTGVREFLRDGEPGEIARCFGFSLSFIDAWTRGLGAGSGVYKRYLAH